AAQADYGPATINAQGQIVGSVVSAQNVGGITLGGDGQTFSVGLAHLYADEGTYNITITIKHKGTPAQVVMTTGVVGKTNANISITGVNTTYDSAGHAASGTAAGVESPTPANLTSELHLFYSSDGGNTFTTAAPVNAGTYEVYYTFDGDTDYNTIANKT